MGAPKVEGVMRAQEHVRNFCIVAHIDHGKSTLADRLLEACGNLSEREMRDQVLDQMDLERERGITIKASAVRLLYQADDGQEYELNLIDTPGHVDFSYEVSRSLSACEGAILVVDASQGVEAQTVANVYLALDQDLEIVPVVNKIDLPNVDPDVTLSQIESLFGFARDQTLLVSAKEGRGIHELLEAIVRRIPPPGGATEAPLRALIFDSIYDPYRGVITYIRVVDGEVRRGSQVRMVATDKTFEVTEVGVLSPKMTPVEKLQAGDVGYLTAGIKRVADTRVGDTITGARRPAPQALPGYRVAKPMVFCGLYPVDGKDLGSLKDALGKLALNDAALHYEPESSAALGFGFRCGFLGLLHMDIVQERLEREYDLNLIATAASVVYRVHRHGGEVLEIDNPASLPDEAEIEFIEEPYVEATVMTPSSYIGAVMEVSQARRGEYLGMDHIEGDRVAIRFDLPLAEIILDYFDELKSRTRGYASLDYDFKAFRRSDLVRMTILINHDPVDALAVICHRATAQQRGRMICDRMKEAIPRQLFEVRVQAAIGSRILASTRIRPLRKNVTAKCYGGDVTRKRKLLERQKEGKKRMKQVGNVEVPQEAFLAILRISDDD